MIYGTEQTSDIVTGKLKFDTGKTIYLNSRELLEFEQKIRDWQYQAVEKERIRNE